MKRSAALDDAGGLGRYLRDISRFPVLSAEEERDLARSCRAALVTANLRFVVRIAREYRAYGYRLADLVQEGNLGLLRAVERFDPDRGVRLVTYASWWIRAYIQGFIMRSHSLVKLGTTVGQRRLFSSLAATRRELERTAGGDADAPDLDAIASRLSVTRAEVEEMMARLAAHDVPLDEPAPSDHRSSAAALATEGPPQDHALGDAEEAHLVRAHVARALAELGERERYVVERRLMCDEPVSLRELGQRLGVSRERVRQLEVRARQKLEAALQVVAAELAWPATPGGRATTRAA